MLAFETLTPDVVFADLVKSSVATVRKAASSLQANFFGHLVVFSKRQGTVREGELYVRGMCNVRARSSRSSRVCWPNC